MRVVYLIQSHKSPQQIYRLINTIKRSSSNSVVLVIHDATSCDLDESCLSHLSDVYILKLYQKGGRGDFHMNQTYLDGVEWLAHHNIEYDWLINLSGQDYPVQPLHEIEATLSRTECDGFLHHFELFVDSAKNGIGAEEGRNRYLYQYWRSGVYLPPSNTLFYKAFNRFGLIFNRIQPLFRMSWHFDGLMFGIRALSSPFNENFVCYAGSYYCALSKPCVQYLHDFAKQHPALIRYFKRTCVPNEIFIQTVLVNSKQFKLVNAHKRYLRFADCHAGSPHTLTIADYETMTQGDRHFARKFDIEKDSEILDRLDERVFGLVNQVG